MNIKIGSRFVYRASIADPQEVHTVTGVLQNVGGIDMYRLSMSHQYWTEKELRQMFRQVDPDWKDKFAFIPRYAARVLRALTATINFAVELGRIIRFLLPYMIILSIISLILGILAALCLTSPAEAKGFVDPIDTPRHSDGSWASTHGENPEYQPRWMIMCSSTPTRGAPGYDMKVTGALPKGTRVLPTELWQGWTYLYVEKVWVRIPQLCDTWQPKGWNQNP